jgi:hypothetical protein
MSPIGFALLLTINPMWFAAVEVGPPQQSTPLPTVLRATLTATPEECPWEMPSSIRLGQEMMDGHLGASLRSEQNHFDGNYAPSSSPLFWNSTVGGADEAKWEVLHLGWYGRTWFSLVGPVNWRPGTSSYVEHVEYLLVEWGPRPVWLEFTDHARPSAHGSLFCSDEPDITRHRAIAQRTSGPRRRYLFVGVEVDE